MKAWLCVAVMIVAGCDEPVPEVPIRQSLTPVGGAPRPQPLINFATNISIDSIDSIISTITIGTGCTVAGCDPASSTDVRSICAGGACDEINCTAGTKNCDQVGSCETSVNTNLANCGSCGNNCEPTGTTVSATCSGGACSYPSCGGTLRNCDGVGSCETDVSNTLTACGSCTTNCNTTLANTSATGRSCSGSVCNYTSCNTNFADCDLIRTNGCEVNTSTSKMNCGACNQPCVDPANGVAACVSSMCTFQCNSGFKKCGMACVPTASCCLDTDCQTPPDDCKERIGHCGGGSCTYNAIVCPTVDCKNPPMCMAGNCVYSEKPVGTDCSMSGCFTAGDGGAPICQRNDGGIYCDGVPKNCTNLDTQCAKGVCDSTGACAAQPVNVNGSCATDNCQVDAVCAGGICRGMPKSCPAAPACRVAYCEGASGDCHTDRLAAAGEPCESDNPCLRNLRCDGAGNCVGDPAQDFTPCFAPSDCTIGASCLSGQCLCDDAFDLASNVPEDMSANVDGGKPTGKDGCGGCAVGDGNLNGAWLVLLGALALLRRRRRSA